ncbi:MAG: hypothetical protein ABI134_25855 [Byssovorax sp.]
MRLAMVLLVALASPLGCNPQPMSAPTPPAATPLPAVPTAAIAPSAAPATSDCVELGCRLFDTPADAFRAILESKPLVIAVGEAHAQKGTEGIPSSAKRFTGELLPLLEGRASDLLVELMAPPAGCKKVTEQVKTKQKVVTEKQTESAQSEYVIMGNEAKKRGLVPDLLRPSCADLDAIDKAGDEAIGTSLATIARLTKTKVGELLDRNAKASADRIVATYGGAMHNDLTPAPERAAWSFGPELSARAKGRYVEIDLFVPEFIQDTESWKKLPWYPHFDRDRHPEKTTLFNPRPGSYVLIFPRTAR